MIDKTLELKLHNQAINIKYFDFNRKLRNNIVFLHGLAATKDDFFWVCKYFENYRIIWFDYPTQINNLSIKDICDIFFELTKKLEIHNINLIGHSLGWVAWIYICEKNPEKRKSFVNIEWNLQHSERSFLNRIASLNNFEFTKKFNNQTSIKSLAKDLVYKSKNNNLLKRFQKLPVKKNLYIQRTKLW